MKEEQILHILPVQMRGTVEGLHLEFQHLQEIRIRVGQYMILQYGGREIRIAKENRDKITSAHMKEIIGYVSQYSLYAYEQELKQGYITIEGGHRVGLTGKVILEQGKVKSMKYMNAINIRVAHEVIGSANQVLPYIIEDQEVQNTLIISPPRCGKTTILRDVIRQISDGNHLFKGCSVGVVDERSELGACYEGIPQNQLGSRTDILDGCPKTEGMMMLVRSMSPQVLVVDEIGSEEDMKALEYALHCGCKMVASIHGLSLNDIKQKPLLKKMIANQIFKRYVILSNQPDVGSVREVYDGNGVLLYQANR